MSPSQNLADKITTFFYDFDMLGGATEEELYEVIWKALEYHDKEQIQTIKDYFRDIKWANDRAQELYRQIDLWY